MDCLLPKRLKADFDFHLSIFTAAEDDFKDFNKRYKQLKSKITELRPNLNVKISLYTSSGKSNFHDRTILTNNNWISCDGGFNLFNEKGRATKSTKISIIYPHIQAAIEWALPAYNNLLQQTYKTKQKIETGCGGSVYPKNDAIVENRLYLQHN